MSEPPAKRQKISRFPVDFIISEELATVLVEVFPSTLECKTEKRTCGWAFEQMSRQTGTYQERMRLATLNPKWYQWPPIVRKQMFWVMLVGINDAPKCRDSLLCEVLTARPTLIEGFYEVLKEGGVKGSLDFKQIFPNKRGIMYGNPGVFVAMVKEGYIELTTPSDILELMEFSLRSRDGLFGGYAFVYPTNQVDIATQLLEWAPEDGCAIRLLEANSQSWDSAIEGEDGVEIKIVQEDGGTRVTLLDAVAHLWNTAPHDRSSHAQLVERIRCVFVAYDTALTRMIKYKNGLIQHVNTECAMLPRELRSLVVSHVIP